MYSPVCWLVVVIVSDFSSDVTCYLLCSFWRLQFLWGGMICFAITGLRQFGIYTIHSHVKSSMPLPTHPWRNNNSLSWAPSICPTKQQFREFINFTTLLNSICLLIHCPGGKKTAHDAASPASWGAKIRFDKAPPCAPMTNRADRICARKRADREHSIHRHS